MADGVWGLAISPVAATLEAGTMVLSTVEAAALGTGAARPPRQLRPARSFFGGARLLPLAQSMMTQLEVEVGPPAISHAPRPAISSRSRLELLSSPPRSLEAP